MSERFVPKHRPIREVRVPAVEHDALLRPAKLRAAQTTPDHLLVEHLTHRGARDHDVSDAFGNATRLR